MKTISFLTVETIKSEIAVTADANSVHYTTSFIENLRGFTCIFHHENKVEYLGVIPVHKHLFNFIADVLLPKTTLPTSFKFIPIMSCCRSELLCELTDNTAACRIKNKRWCEEHIHEALQTEEVCELYLCIESHLKTLILKQLEDSSVQYHKCSHNKLFDYVPIETNLIFDVVNGIIADEKMCKALNDCVLGYKVSILIYGEEKPCLYYHLY